MRLKGDSQYAKGSNSLSQIMPISEGGISALDGKELLATFDVNVISTHRMTTAMIPLLRKGSLKKVVMM